MPAGLAVPEEPGDSAPSLELPHAGLPDDAKLTPVSEDWCSRPVEAVNRPRRSARSKAARQALRPAAARELSGLPLEPAPAPLGSPAALAATRLCLPTPASLSLPQAPVGE